MNSRHRARREASRKLRGREQGPAGDVNLRSIQFGSGVLFAKPVSGNPVDNPTPMKLGKLEKVSFNLPASSVEIERDLISAWGKFSVSGKITRLKINSDIMVELAKHRTGGGSSRQRRLWRRTWSPRRSAS